MLDYTWARGPERCCSRTEMAAQVIGVCLSYLVVSLNQHHSIAKVLEAGLDHQFDPIAAHAVLR